MFQIDFKMYLLNILLFLLLLPVAFCFTVSLGGGRGMMLQPLSHMLYSNNNIWRVTSGCGVQHTPRRMTNELSLAHIARFHLTVIAGVNAQL